MQQSFNVISEHPHMSKPFQTPKGFWPRVGSNLIDGLVFIVPSFILGTVISISGGRSGLRTVCI